MTGAEMIAAERKRQIEVEGWTREHDEQHTAHELTHAAVAYAQESIARCCSREIWHHAYNPPLDWPWAPSLWKPDDPIRNLVKAGALIAAEIDRLLAAQQSGGADHD